MSYDIMLTHLHHSQSWLAHNNQYAYMGNTITATYLKIQSVEKFTPFVLKSSQDTRIPTITQYMLERNRFLINYDNKCF